LQIVFALVEPRMPAALSQLEFSAEADAMTVTSANRPLLEQVFALIWEAVADHRLLQAAMDQAREHLE
jgi:hypothetical protein